MKKMLVFTDLDGSLLDHTDYLWQAAEPALQALEENAFPVVFTSSKTSAEMIELRKETGNQHPFISENGSVAHIPREYFKRKPDVSDCVPAFESFLFARSYPEIIITLKKLRRKYNYNFHGFYDMELDELIELTGLDRNEALNALLRKATEPLLWRDTDDAFKAFRKHIEDEGLVVTSGGRFVHVMSDINKGATVEWMVKQYQLSEPDTQWITVCIGDSVNDIEMLEVADLPVLIPNPNTNQPELSYIRNLRMPAQAGSAGWNEAVQGLINELLQGKIS